MSVKKYFPPEYSVAQFHCPHCGVFADQLWSYMRAIGDYSTFYDLSEVNFFEELLPTKYVISYCKHCDQTSLWVDKQMVSPKTIPVQDPNEDLSEDIKKDYIEAARILNDSPRASAALLRLALQKLCKELGGEGKNINDDIASLVRKGLNPLVQKSLDSLRITGNNAVHPGEIDLIDEPERVLKLFDLVNFVAEKMVSEPNEIRTFYDSLPESSKKQVGNRDKLLIKTK